MQIPKCPKMLAACLCAFCLAGSLWAGEGDAPATGNPAAVADVSSANVPAVESPATPEAEPAAAETDKGDVSTANVPAVEPPAASKAEPAAEADKTASAVPAANDPAAENPSKPETESAATATRAAEESAAASDTPEIPLIPFKGYDLNGKPVDVAACIGNKPVALIFWATWCSACRAEIPHLNRLAAKYADRGMDFIGVNVAENDSYKRAKAFAERAKMQYPTIFDGSQTIAWQYRVRGLPTVVIADKKGIIRFYGHSTPDIDDAIFAKLTAD